MSHNAIVALNVLSVATGAAAALLLYWGSLGIPWKLRSWSGETPIEKRYERTQRIMAWVGIPCVIVAAGCQLAAILLGSN
jgi:hypothetical protein